MSVDQTSAEERASILYLMALPHHPEWFVPASGADGTNVCAVCRDSFGFHIPWPCEEVQHEDQ